MNSQEKITVFQIVYKTRIKWENDLDYFNIK
jgi:hypothetical protein